MKETIQTVDQDHPTPGWFMELNTKEILPLKNRIDIEKLNLHKNEVEEVLDLEEARILLLKYHKALTIAEQQFDYVKNNGFQIKDAPYHSKKPIGEENLYSHIHDLNHLNEVQSDLRHQYREGELTASEYEEYIKEIAVRRHDLSTGYITKPKTNVRKKVKSQTGFTATPNPHRLAGYFDTGGGIFFAGSPEQNQPDIKEEQVDLSAGENDVVRPISEEDE